MPTARLARHAALVLVVLGAATPGTADALTVLPGVQQAFPGSGAALPTNARPLLFVLEPNGPVALDVVRVTPAGDVALTTRDFHGTVAIDPGPLVAGESVVVRADVTEVPSSFVVEWTVGGVADDAAPTWDDGEPSVSVLASTDGGLFPTVLSYELDVTLPAVRDEGPFVIRLEGDEDVDVVVQGVREGTAPVILNFFVPGGEARRFCFTPVAVDVAGNEAPFDAPVCAELDPSLTETPTGCASSSESTGSLAAGLAVCLLALRGRRGVRPVARPSSTPSF